MRLIPQYSIRWLLLVMTASAVAFSIVALALRGHPWAIGVAVGLASLVVLGLVYAVVFALFWPLAELSALAERKESGGRSPFGPPPPGGEGPDGGKETPAAPILLE